MTTMFLVELLKHPFFLAALTILLLFLVTLKAKSHKDRLLPCPQPQLPIIGHLHFVGPLLHQSFHRLSLRYGQIFFLRLGSVPCVVTSSPRFAKQILNANEHFFDWRFQTKAVECLSQKCSFAFAPYGPYWKLVRKLSTNEFLGTRRVNSFQAARAEECRRLLRLLAQKAEAREVVNLSEELLKLTNNVICRMMLGHVVEAWTVVRDVSNIFNLFNMSDFIWVFRKLDLQGVDKRVDSILERFHAILDRLITQHQQEMEAGKKSVDGHCREMECFLDALLDYSENETTETALTRTHIKAILVDFFTAGMDNLAIAVEWCLAELVNHPKILEKAREEIQDVVGNRRLTEEYDCPSLPYIQAIVKEAYRLHPPLPVTARRCLQDCTILDYVIPKNTVLFVNIWAMGRDPKNWESPLEFRPERFLKSREVDGMDLQEVNGVGQTSSYLPFGSGRRICPGMALAMQEIPAVVAGIIQCFDLEITGFQGGKLSTTLDMEESPGLTAPRASNLLCVPIARCNAREIIGTILEQS